MWLLVVLALAGQVDDILADEAKKSKTPSAAVAPTEVAPSKAAPATAVAPATTADESPAVAQTKVAEAKGEEATEESQAEPGGLSKVLSDISKTGALGYMLAGGIFMWPILAMGILALGVIIERYRAL